MTIDPATVYVPWSEYDDYLRVGERPFDESVSEYDDYRRGLRADTFLARLLHCRHGKHREWLGPSTKYLWFYSKYEWMGCDVHTCSRCGKRVRGAVVIINAPQHPRTYQLIEDTCKKIGKWPLPTASGYHCEMPVAVSRIIESYGEDAARSFIARQFGEDGCQEAFDNAPYLKV